MREKLELWRGPTSGYGGLGNLNFGGDGDDGLTWPQVSELAQNGPTWVSQLSQLAYGGFGQGRPTPAALQLGSVKTRTFGL